MHNSFLPFKKDCLKSRLYNLVYILTLIIITVSILMFLNREFNIYVPCLFREITGFYCPGCGITRGLISLLRLDFYQAFRYNVLLIPAVPFILLCIIDNVVSYIRNKDCWFYSKIPNKIWMTLLIIVIAFGILRNIPGLEFLAPTEV